MNLTIWTEVVAAPLALSAVLWIAVTRLLLNRDVRRHYS